MTAVAGEDRKGNLSHKTRKGSKLPLGKVKLSGRGSTLAFTDYGWKSFIHGGRKGSVPVSLYESLLYSLEEIIKYK